MFLLEVRLKAFQMVQIVYFCIVSTSDQVLSLEGFLNLAQEGCLELFVDALVDINVINAYASLSAVQPLAKYYPYRCTIKISSLVDYDRALATKLQDAWR